MVGEDKSKAGLYRTSFVVIFTICFLSELVVMLLLASLDFENMGNLTEALLDSLLLSTMVVAALGLFSRSGRAVVAEATHNIKDGGSFQTPMIILMIIGAIAGFLYFELDQSQNKLEHDFKGVIARTTTMRELQNSFGYGGFIHAFKNYVLRGNGESLDLFTLKHSKLELLLVKYRGLTSDEYELEKLSVVEEVIDEYTKNSLRIPMLMRMGKTPSQIDMLVKVDDSRCLDALDWLMQKISEEQQTTVALMNETSGRMTSIFLFAFLTASLLVFVVSYLSRRKLTVARIIAEDSAKAKTEFLANMSHEIRTPLNGIIGMAELLIGTEMNKTQSRYTQVIRSSGITLASLVNDILDLSKIDAGKLSLELIEFDLRELMEQHNMILSFGAKEKGLKLLYSVSEEIPSLLKGDPGRIKQILTNLIGNSIKFTEEGTVSVTCTLSSESEGECRVHFSIKDTGIGIAQENQDKLFGKFTQADSSTTRKYGGSGLGLSICKQLSTMMGGDIGIVSELGKGAEFWFTIKLERVKELDHVAEPMCAVNQLREQVFAPTEKEGVPSKESDMSILLVEDNAVNRMVATAMLNRLGYKVDVAENGLEAIHLLMKISYDLVLMDMQMPVMDGLEATRHIRDKSSQVRDHDVYIVAMTANAMQEDKDSCMQAGMNDYTSKPIDLTRLGNLIEKVGHQRSAR